MYSCNVCSKAYASKGALTRHQNNHTQQLALTCLECNVTFRRKDLMVRHARIHQTSTTSHQRRRCHTACEGCRRLRSKCDGGRPCTSCSSTGLSCVYPRSIGRLSRMVSNEQPLTEDRDPVIREPAADDNSIVSLVRSARDEVGFTLDERLATYVGDRDVNTPPLQASPTTDLQSDNPIDWSFDESWSFSPAWQWTHEDLYLQGPGGILPLEDSTLSSAIHSERQDPGTSCDAVSAEFSTASLHLTTSANSSQSVEVVSLPYHADQAQGNACGERRQPREVLEVLIGDLIDLAMANGERCMQSTGEWHTLDERLSSMITTADVHQSDQNCRWYLDDLTKEYFIHFHPLWPLILDTSINVRTLHPLLYLTLTSIGALYQGTSTAVHYGSITHRKIRDVLIHKDIGSNQTAAEALDIGRAMLLTQVAALYFEQEKAFSAAQQLGAKLNSHAHRMRLFTLSRQDLAVDRRPWRDADTMVAESRRMLAYGILRAETFMSVVFNRKPLLSYEEMKLPLPLAGFSGTVSNSPVQDGLLLDQNTPLACAGMLFSDLVRVSLDEDEILPMMKPTDLELLVFGLQNDVWRFCQDPGMFRRLIHQHRPGFGNEVTSASLSCDVDLLDQTSRKMTNLVHEYNSIVSALARWKKALSQSQLSHPPDQDRSAYLSGLILYELSFLRLCAPVEAILQIVYHDEEMYAGDAANVQQVMEWTASSQAVDAVSHADSICRLLYAETARPYASQAKYNILTLIAVHHAAAITWAIIGGGAQRELRFAISDPFHSERYLSLTLETRNSTSILSHFANLYPKITSSWGMQSSFHKIVKKLANRPFPFRSAALVPVARMTPTMYD